MLNEPVYEGTYMPECSGKQHKLNTYFVKHVSHRESQREPDAFSTNVSATEEIKSSLKCSASSDNDKNKYVNRQTEIRNHGQGGAMLMDSLN